MDVYNFVDWWTMITGLLLIYSFEDLQKERSSLVSLLVDGPTKQLNSDPVYRDSLYTTTYKCIIANERMEFCLLALVIMATIRLFKGFSAQPRLGLVTSTLASAASDIMHFLLVFISVFMAAASVGKDLGVFWGRMLQLVRIWGCLGGERRQVLLVDLGMFWGRERWGVS